MKYPKNLPSLPALIVRIGFGVTIYGKYILYIYIYVYRDHKQML